VQAVRRVSRAELATGFALLGYHAVAHGRGKPAARLGANLAAATAAVIGARAARFSAQELGLEVDRLASGARIGAVASLPVAAVVAGGFGAPRTRGALGDDRTIDRRKREMAYELFLRIPLETALAEEVLFRGAYLALARRNGSDIRAIALTSLVFGLWHIPPAFAALDRTTTGKRAERRTHRVFAVAGMVGATAAAGAGLAVLRLRARSVMAPVVVHAVLNATGLTGSWVAARRS